ncbi:hypothetical protein [Hoeflea sp.]|uniref:hypothetical protein n=1 Tax=Hoeflea sp. TaxID=1940281 RepID=UPI0019A38538|nr:hypothetical protein [Hoeflea sp.]MBC7280008.1 hypothetical protein [Hoeflea sp.]
MTSASITLIDGARLTEERAKAARGTDAPALAAIAVLILFAIATGVIAIAAGA